MTAPGEFEEPWSAVAHGDGALEQELRRELAPDHALFGRSVRAAARRQDRDDVLFELTDTGECAVVHLTWTGRPERPPLPMTRMFESISLWMSTAMMRDRADFDGDK
jgi:hypothetical protein